ncbi:MAG: DNA primase [Pseudorhodoplanes sp.]|nr:DNA primase [Pseudorhodoplanes sp.]MBW7950462.1 DNA primase [Pseudorhodoplanes sp.]MCL4710347.1 DNA primase [Pseudorhodoplanes sp.]GIK81371.1 MAG: DNA primase [Alphaproteobacteria bacterium]
MRYSPQFLDELRARLPVSEVVGRRVKLKKAGREWKGLSPFNQEKTPSFFVNDQKQAWFDFSSGKNGSIFDFVMLTEGVTFPEAVERLASMAGVPLPAYSREDDVRDQRRKTLHDVVELAAKFFEATLAARAGARARGYLADRGIAPATQLQFRLGYAPPERFALKEHLGSHGIAVEDMIEAGLVIAGDDIPVPYDRFRDRVMFPITDWRGRVIAFGGRALDPDVSAKYLNSPETPLFHKGANLYNGAAARKACHDGAPLIVVEGYVDVIAMVTAGFPATVAPLGTALTEDQLSFLWKMADEPVLCFDGDGAGRRAAYRAADLALPRLSPGKSLSFALLPEGQDPDDLARAGGREAIAEVLASARPLADMIWMRETESASFDTPERRAALEKRLNEIVGTIREEAVRKYYRQDFEARVRALFSPIAANAPYERGRGYDRGYQRNAGRGARAAREPFAPLSPRLPVSPLVRGFKSALPPREALILFAVIHHPWLLEAHAEEFAELDFIHAEADLMRRAILEAGADEAAVDSAALQAALIRRGLDSLLTRVKTAITHASDWPAHAGAAGEDVVQWWAHVVTLHRKKRTLNKELKDAERALGEDPSEANWAWIRDVQERLQALEGTEALIEGFGILSGRPVRSV